VSLIDDLGAIEWPVAKLGVEEVAKLLGQQERV